MKKYKIKIGALKYLRLLYLEVTGKCFAMEVTYICTYMIFIK
jgi:hypothetical protein